MNDSIVYFLLRAIHSHTPKVRICTKDKDVWLSTETGAHFKLDNKTGAIKSGLGNKVKNISEFKAEKAEKPEKTQKTITNTEPHSVAVVPKKSPAAYLKEHEGDKRKAITSYFKGELQGNYVERTGGNFGNHKIMFTGNALKKLGTDVERDEDKYEAIFKIPHILKHGKYLGVAGDGKSHGGYDQFHYFQDDVLVNGKQITVIVDVGERLSHSKKDAESDYIAYNLNHSGRRNFAEKQAKISEYATGKDKARGIFSPGDYSIINVSSAHRFHSPAAQHIFDTESVTHIYEVVNIRIKK